MEHKDTDKVISRIILGQSMGSVRSVIGLFVICATVTKLLYNQYLPELIDFNEIRWTIIAAGTVFFFLTYVRFKSTRVISYISFLVYFSSLIYVVNFVLVNHFHPATVTILILIIGASTVIINSLAYYTMQSALIIIAAFIVFEAHPISPENTIAFYNLLLATGVFAIVVIIRLKLISSVKHSHDNLEKLNVLSVVVNKEGKVVFISPSVGKLLGYDASELVQDGWWKFKNLSTGWISRDHILDHPNIIAKEFLSMETHLTAKDGKIKWFNWSNSILPNGNYLGIALDVTKYKER